MAKIDTLLFFGSFDPFTIGHARVVQQGIEQINSPHGVVIIPAWQAVWGKSLTSFEKRKEIIELTIESFPKWEGKVGVSLVEEQEHFSGKTIETLGWYASHFPREKFGILMGSDSLLSFDKWERFADILNMAILFVVLRGDETKESLVAEIPESLRSFLSNRIFFLQETKNDAERFASSTQAREEIRVAGDTEHVVPSVLEYIKKHQLYMEPRA